MNKYCLNTLYINTPFIHEDADDAVSTHPFCNNRTLDLNARLIKHPTQTFYLTATGDSMEGWGIFDGDLLVVDRSVTPRLGHILVAMLDEEVLINRYALHRGTPHLCSAHPHYPPLPLEGTDCQLWGVVRAVIHEYLP